MKFKDKNLGVVPGQRYRVTGSSFSVWEVLTVARYPVEPMAHVQLSRVGAPRDLKTVSLKILRDKRYYEPVV